MGISGELYNLLENYLSGRFQRVVLNGQTSSWRPVLAGVPQGSILGPLLFLVYINDLPDGLKSNAELFADETSLFTIVKDKNESSNILNDDLQLISSWAYKWKMLFNPDPKKGISVIKKLRHTLPRKSLITTYKVFLRPLIDYGDIIYDQPNNDSFCEKLESIQYKAALELQVSCKELPVIEFMQN